MAVAVPWSQQVAITAVEADTELLYSFDAVVAGYFTSTWTATSLSLCNTSCGAGAANCLSYDGKCDDVLRFDDALDH